MLKRKKRKCRVGIVLRDKSDKTRHVSVERTHRHSFYGRVLRTKKKFLVHDEKNISRIGDVVEIMESRSFSKTKKWVLVRIINKMLPI
ncbi:MAG: 30S ribosomal protein S17 [Endomicrobium sp.]|jgi:small subunit ribosomal protein S17|nr:30S ribosomal protein S17 [Endomicrobium sp.]